MIRYVLVILAVMSAFSCSKYSCTGEDEISIIGKWKLVERLVDPGDGSGRYKKINTDRTVEFFEDGRVLFNQSICDADFVNGDTESGIYTENQTVIIPDCFEGNVFYRYSIQGSCLILSPSCFEGCGDKYVRI